MVAAEVVLLPRGFLAARDPLTGHPPAAHFLRVRWVGQVDDHHDVADVAFRGGRDVRVAAVEVEPVHALPLGLPAGDEPRAVALADVVDAEAALELGRGPAIELVHLVVGDHDVAGHAHLVRVRALGHLEQRQRLGFRRLAHVDDERPVRRAHHADVCVAVARHHLPAARAVDVADETNAFALCHVGQSTFAPETLTTFASVAMSSLRNFV